MKALVLQRWRPAFAKPMLYAALVSEMCFGGRSKVGENIGESVPLPVYGERMAAAR